MVEVEDQPTGSISLSGGYSTTQGIMAELAYTETNFLGRGQYVRLSVSDGQYSQGWKASFTEPYFLGQRLAAGFDLYHQVNLQNQYALYENWTTGGTLRLGIPVTDDLTFQPNYALYQSKITIPNTSSQPYDDCYGPNAPWVVGGTFYAVTPTAFINCLTNGEAPVEIKQAAAQGAIVTSLVGFSISYNTLDNRKDPDHRLVSRLTSRTSPASAASPTSSARRSTRAGIHPITEDFIGQIHLQGGQINGFGSQPLDMINNFIIGPTLVRGFAPGGIGPRDIASGLDNIQGAALGGTTYYGASAEVDFPIFGLPKEIGLKGALFADAGNLIGYSGQTNFSNFLGYTYCPGQNVVPDHAAELRQRLGPEPDPQLGRREHDLGLARWVRSGSISPCRCRRASTTRRRSSTSRAARRSSLERPCPTSSRARHELTRPSSHLTEPLVWPRSASFRKAAPRRWPRSRPGAARRLPPKRTASRVIQDVAALDQAGPGDLTFLDNPRYLDAFRATRAAAALVAPRYRRSRAGRAAPR